MGTRGYNEVAVMYRYLRERGVPASVIFTDHAGLRTLDSMARAAEVFQVENALVVTQRYHLPRALYLADQYGIKADGLIADRRAYQYRRRDAVRETLARFFALVDRYVLRRGPRHTGPPVPITGPAAASHDDSIRAADPHT